MKTEFRLFRESEYVELKEMVFSLYREDPEGEPMSEEKIRRSITEYRKNSDKLRIYTFHKTEEVIGYAILVFFWSNEYGGDILTIDELYVKEAYRSLGVGTEFFAFLEEMEGKVVLQLETTSSNGRVRDYYKKLGFSESENTHLIKKC